MIELQPQQQCSRGLEQEENRPKPLQLHLQIASQPLQCRICLEQETMQSFAGNPLIAPCKCTGSISYVHTSCLSTWIMKSYLDRIHHGPQCCEICLHPYLINKKCHPKLTCKKRNSDYLIMFLVCISFLLVGLVGLPVLYRTPFELDVVKFILMGVLISILAVVLVCGSICFYEAFVEVRRQWTVLPYQKISMEPTLISLATEQASMTPLHAGRRLDATPPRSSSRSQRATSANIVSVHPL